MMRAFLACILLPVLVRAEPAKSDSNAKGQEYVDMSVRRSFANAYDIEEFRLNVRMHVSSFANSLSFSGQPLNGSMYTGGTTWSINGGQVLGSVSKGFNGFSVTATVYRAQGPALQLFFTIQANGRMDDPNYAPSFSVFNGDASLNMEPVFNGREYRINGRLDTQRFGAEGAALSALVLSGYMDGRQPKTKRLPSAEWLEKSQTLGPILRNNGTIPLR